MIIKQSNLCGLRKKFSLSLIGNTETANSEARGTFETHHYWSAIDSALFISHPTKKDGFSFWIWTFTCTGQKQFRGEEKLIIKDISRRQKDVRPIKQRNRQGEGCTGVDETVEKRNPETFPLFSSGYIAVPLTWQTLLIKKSVIGKVHGTNLQMVGTS